MRRRAPQHPSYWVVRVVAVLVLGFLVAPALVVVPLSFAGDVMTRFPPERFSLEAYTSYFHGPGWLSSTLFSIEVAGIVMLLSIFLGTMTSLGLVRARGTIGRLCMILVLSP